MHNKSEEPIKNPWVVFWSLILNIMYQKKGIYLIKKQENYFGKEVFKFIQINIVIFFISLPFGLCFGLCPLFESNTLKHFFWGTFCYSISFLFIIVSLHEIKKNKIIYKTIYFSLGISVFFAFIFELTTMDKSTFINQFNEICIDIIGSIVIFGINYIMYRKIFEN